MKFARGGVKPSNAEAIAPTKDGETSAKPTWPADSKRNIFRVGDAINELPHHGIL